MSETDLEFLDLTDTTALRWSALRVRVSAPLRRGAAPYADGSLRSQAPSYLIFLLNLSGSGAGTRGDLREILCTTQWRKKFGLVRSPPTSPQK